MKVEVKDGKSEQQVVIGMITDSAALGRIATKWGKDMLPSKWSNMIGGWCVNYFNEYGKAPRRTIRSLFDSWVEKGRRDKEVVNQVDRFLSGLSDEFTKSKKHNPDYIVDLAAKVFNIHRARKIVEGVEADLTNGDLDKAWARFSGSDKVELGEGACIDVLGDVDAIREAFEYKRDPLIEFDGALGQFWQDAIERDAFISLLGPEKRQKTWFEIDLAWRAMMQRRRVAFFEVGDMSQNQIMRRFMVRASGRPLRPCTVRYPTKIKRRKKQQENEPALVQFKEREFKKALTWRTAVQACEQLRTDKLKSNDALLKLACYPNDTVSIKDIRTVLDGWVRGGWVPDIVVIDYADILAPINDNDDERVGINKTWKQMRALAQTLHCCVITATQANRGSYKAFTLGREHVSDDKRKHAHVTGMLGLNQTAMEKESQIMRLNWLDLRERDFSETKCVHLAGCLAIGNPAVRSTW